MKVVVVYRVIQGWRTPVFSKLAEQHELKLLYGCDFPGTKVVSARGPFSFNAKKLLSFPLSIKGAKGNMLLPITPFLFIELIKCKPDVVLCEGASNFINNISIFLYCRIFKKKMIQWGLGEIRERKKSKIRKFLDPLIVPIEKRADAIVSYSTEGAKYYEKIGVSKEKIFIAVNVVDTDKRLIEIANFNKRNNKIKLTNSSFKIVFVGALEANKNIEMLINVCKNLIEKLNSIELHIVGSGSDEIRLKGLVEQYQLSQNIFFYGRVNGPLIDIVHDKDIFVMPGLGGLAVSDMLCHSIPVICGIGDGCELDLINGNNGIVIDDLNESNLSIEIEKLIKEPLLLKKMKQEAFNTIKTHNISNYVAQIQNAINYSVKDKKN